MPRGARVFGFWGLFITATVLAVFAIDRYVPGQHVPWKSLDPARPLGMSTKAQLLRLSVSPSETCMDLARGIEGYETLPSEPKRPKGVNAQGCGWDIARIVYGTEELRLSPGEANMQCPLSVGAYLWMRELNAHAQTHFGQALSDVHHYGTYSCRRQRGNSSGAWSEHAFANAWDIASFELSDGTLISVKSDWGKSGAKYSFLKDARKSACKIFNVTLSPDYNAAHHDHFHLDMGPSRSCR